MFLSIKKKYFMSNNTSSGSSTKNLKESKIKKKNDYTKEISDLEKVMEKIEEKYLSGPNSYTSSAIMNLKSCIDGLKKSI